MKVLLLQNSLLLEDEVRLWTWVGSKVFFLLAIYCQIVKCDSDPAKLTKERLEGHRQLSTFFTDLVASTSYKVML